MVGIEAVSQSDEVFRLPLRFEFLLRDLSSTGDFNISSVYFLGVCDIQAAWGIQANKHTPHPGVEDALYKGSNSTEEASEATEKQASVFKNRRKTWVPHIFLAFFR